MTTKTTEVSNPMTEQYPDWVYDEMAKRINNTGGAVIVERCKNAVNAVSPIYVVLAKLIHETQEAPEDPYLPIARKVAAEMFLKLACSTKFVQRVEAGERDTHVNVQIALTAIHALLEHQEQQA